MLQDHIYFMRMALAEAEKAGNEGNAPAGSVVVRNGQLVARGRNIAATAQDSTAHAEVVAIREANKSLGSMDLSECTLYTTFEPCPMCLGAILVARISTLVLGARLSPGRAEKWWGEYTVERLIMVTGKAHRLQLVTGVLAEECVQASWKSYKRPTS